MTTTGSNKSVEPTGARASSSIGARGPDVTGFVQPALPAPVANLWRSLGQVRLAMGTRSGACGGGCGWIIVRSIGSVALFNMRGRESCVRALPRCWARSRIIES